MTCYYSGKPNADFFLGLAANIALSYSSIVIGLNFTCTVLICVRILWVSSRLKQTLGREASRTYTGAAALIIESMLPYTLFGIAYVATLGVNHPTSILFLSLYVMFTVRGYVLTLTISRSHTLFLSLVHLATDDHPPRSPGPRLDEEWGDGHLIGLPLDAGSPRGRF